MRHYLRKFKDHFTLPPLRVEIRPIMALNAYGICFPPSKPGEKYLILLDAELKGTRLRDVLLHELAHAEAMHLHQDYEHGKAWHEVCARVSAATGISIE